MPGLQEQFLNRLRKESIPATFYLVNGYQIKGLIRAFDDYTLLIESGNLSQLVFKHALSTVAPQKPLRCELEA